MQFLYSEFECRFNFICQLTYWFLIVYIYVCRFIDYHDYVLKTMANLLAKNN
jgi:hypothetical protein